MNRKHRLRQQSGLTLVELLISLTIGLVVLAGVIGVLIANRQTYRTSEALARMQENARFSFEILGRSLRAAGGNPCGATKIANVLNNRSTAWWANWNNAVRGFEGGNSAHDAQFPQAIGSASPQRVTATDAIIIIGSLDNGALIVNHEPASAQFKLNSANHGVRQGDIVMACDTQHAAIFQITNANTSNATIVHNTGTETPGNCSKHLGYPVDPNCGNANPNPDPPEYTFETRGFISKLTAQAWYIGKNPRGTRSLYRLNLNGSSLQTEEVVPDVHDLQMTYLQQNTSDYFSADAISDWNKIMAVRVALSTQDPVVRDSDGNYLIRQWYTVFRLRNLQP